LLFTLLQMLALMYVMRSRGAGQGEGVSNSAAATDPGESDRESSFAQYDGDGESNYEMRSTASRNTVNDYEYDRSTVGSVGVSFSNPIFIGRGTASGVSNGVTISGSAPRVGSVGFGESFSRSASMGPSIPGGSVRVTAGGSSRATSQIASSGVRGSTDSVEYSVNPRGTSADSYNLYANQN
jgi:hypothetical protein